MASSSGLDVVAVDTENETTRLPHEGWSLDPSKIRLRWLRVLLLYN